MANKKISDYTNETTPTSGDLHLIQRGSAYLKVDNDNLLVGSDTDDLDEGVTNLYYTDERAQDAVGGMLQSANGLALTYDDSGATITPSFQTGYEPIRYATVQIQHSSILTLNDTPVSLGITVEAGKCIMILEALAYFKCAGATAYTNSGIALVDELTEESYYNWGSDMLNVTTNQYSIGYKKLEEVALSLARPILVKALSANPTGGHASNNLFIHVKYQFSPRLDQL